MEPPNDTERFIKVGDDTKVVVKAVGTFRILILKNSFYSDLVDTIVVQSDGTRIIGFVQNRNGN